MTREFESPTKKVLKVTCNCCGKVTMIMAGTRAYPKWQYIESTSETLKDDEHRCRYPTTFDLCPRCYSDLKEGE